MNNSAKAQKEMKDMARELYLDGYCHALTDLECHLSTGTAQEVIQMLREKAAKVAVRAAIEKAKTQ